MINKILSPRKACVYLIILLSFLTGLLTNLKYNNLNNNNYNSKISTLNSKSLLNSAIKNMKNSENQYVYLSDIPYIQNQSASGWGSISLDKAGDGGLISVKVENAYYTFEKGIWAHATSTVVYDLSNYQDYAYFTSYIGLNKTAASSSNGVKYYIYTSIDGKNWDLKTEEEAKVMKPGANADFIKVNIKGAKFLKLYVNSNGANGNDHSVYADAKLIKEDYKDDFDVIVPSVEEYDTLIKNKFSNASLSNKEYELTLLQREFINRAGNYALKRFLSENDINKEVYTWLISDVDNLRLYILGGAPDGGNYYNSLTELSKLYNEYKEDFTNKKSLNNKWDNSLTYGDLYKKMAITLSLTHSQNVGLWMQASAAENKSDSLRRYAIFKYLHKNGKFKVKDNIDYTSWFEYLSVEEMRFIMNNAIDDEEILWLNAYVQTKIDETGSTGWLTPHPHIAYVWPNYQNNVYYENDAYFNELFSVKKEKTDENKIGLFDLVYEIPGGKNNKTYKITVSKGNLNYKLYKVWMNFRNKFGTGAVCGGISKSGSNIRATHGIPATVIGQPGHAALLYYTKDAEGKGYWGIDNDVSGWTLSEKGERMLLGWGNASYSRGSYQVVYMTLAQEVLNDYENFEKAEKTIMLASVYKDDLKKQEEIYRKALEVQNINIDAWYGLINVYLSDETKTEKDYYDLAEEISNNLKYFPLPMYQLTNLIKPKLTSMEYSFKFTLLQTRTLQEGSNTPNNSATNYYVYQPSITRAEAKYLLGKLDKELATFSFDGENANKIVLASRFDGSGVRLDYSLDGKKTWREISFTAEEEHKILLTEKEINSINSKNDIYVHIVGTNYEEENLYKIDILEQDKPVVYGNDLENKVMGVGDVTEWKMEGNSKWTLFKEKEPDLTGDKTITVRNRSTGVYLTSDMETLNFTTDISAENRKYIPISHLSVESFSSEAANQNRYAKYIIDGNANTSWHSAWNGSDKEKYIVIKFDKVINLSAIEYQPLDGANGKILDAEILGSIDGENFETIGTTSWANNKNLKNIEFDDSPAVKYVKIVGKKTSSASSLSFIAGSMLNFYEDTTKQIEQFIKVKYNITSLTNKDVTAKLISNGNLKIINNDGKDSYVFTENDEFTFEYELENGVRGNITAVVDYIDKELPIAEIEYNITEKTNQKVIATLKNESEPITILNNDGKNTYTFTKNGTFEFEYQDKAGNINKTLATVDWIDGVIESDENENKGDNSNTQKPSSNVNTIKENSNVPSISNNQINQENTYEKRRYVQRITPAIKTETPTSNEIIFKTFSSGIVSLKIDSNIVPENAKLILNKLTLSKNLEKELNGLNNYFELYFVDENTNKINISSTSIKMTIKVNPNKKLVGIYEVKENEVINKLNYKKISNGEVELEVDSLNKYIISYENEVKKITENKKETKTNGKFILIPLILALIIFSIVFIKKKLK